MKQNYLGTYGVLKGSYMESRLKYYDFESTKKAYGDPTSTILKCVRDDENEEYILVELLTTNEKMRIKREGYELVFRRNRMKQVGRIKSEYFQILELDDSIDIVKVNIENLRKHLEKRNHDNMIKYLSRISELLENPDYIGINPRERGKSIEYVIQLEENVLIGIKLDYKNKYFYIATMHEISQLKLNQRIKNGRLKSLTT